MSDLCGTLAQMVTPKGSMSTEGEALQVSVLTYRCSICPPLVTYRAPDKRFSHTFNSLGRWPWPACRFAAHRQIFCWNFMYHPRIVLSVDGSVWYTVQNLRYTVTINSVLVNYKTKNAFLFPVHAMFRQGRFPAVKAASTSRRLVHKKKLEIFCTYWYAPFCCVWLGCCAAEFGSSGGTMSYPIYTVYIYIYIYVLLFGQVQNFLKKKNIHGTALIEIIRRNSFLCEKFHALWTESFLAAFVRACP
jgi:hypothetical protein